MNTNLIQPFRIEVADSAVADLRRRLDDARFPQPLPVDDRSTGIPSVELQALMTRWAQHDWRATEARLNALPQIITNIDGQNIHAVHVRSTHADAMPLLLMHGWPGSFLEFEALIGPLTDPLAHGGAASDAFDVVIPSHPGFGFSTPLVGADWKRSDIAVVMLELMTRLGYERFAIQGGDMGAGVAPEMGRLAPDRVIGIHANGSLGSFVGQVDDETAAALTPLEHDRLRRVGEFMQREFGYISIQSTRPALIGAMLADSPVAQFAWIHDKFQAWTHPAHTPAADLVGERFLFENAALYWLTATGGTAAYVGYAQDAGWGAVPENSGVPTAVMVFAHDVGLRFAEEKSNTIVRWTDVDGRGGHFAALEEPQMLLADVREFFAGLR
ncbi:pimeloyl-ACP methyl ester carboxylesterase [Microbacterium sp. W4I4]|uniref:epoxide hydrolase family protein n=1 Tax=Microbacterium sp. W4I4 TaxID=3042295 RepID=UPI00277DBAFC|nr:epoxide hydrolase [Microbacterium sp. W4I4]MDQ0614358.1 pimeloyl-ACP methyl ester carboxylesterase [Microbacterium sp. W4I4]